MICNAAWSTALHYRGSLGCELIDGREGGDHVREDRCPTPSRGNDVFLFVGGRPPLHHHQQHKIKRYIQSVTIITIIAKKLDC